jgi:hypothetical protein
MNLQPGFSYGSQALRRTNSDGFADVTPPSELQENLTKVKLIDRGFLNWIGAQIRISHA